MVDPLESPKYLTVWAKQQIDDFERQVAEFLKSCKYSTFSEVDSETGEVVVKAKILPNPIPVNFRGMSFNIANALRSALDQTVFTILGTGKIIYFPFRDTPDAFEDAFTKGECKNLPPEITNLLRGFKSYKGGNDLLWALNKMSNANKHAALRPIIAGVSGLSYRDLILRFGARFNPKWDSAKNEMELARFIPSRSGFYFESYLKFSSHVAFDDIEVLRGKPAVAVFRQLSSIVEGIIMTLDAEARRIGRL